jgi:hypothetical protein
VYGYTVLDRNSGVEDDVGAYNDYFKGIANTYQILIHRMFTLQSNGKVIHKSATIMPELCTGY